MKRKVFLSIFVMILITAIFAGTYLYINLGSDRFVTVTVQNLTDTESVLGYVVKNERVIDLSDGNFVRFYCEDGDKVASRSYIASVYDNESDGNILTEIEAIDEKLNNLSDEYISLTMKDVVKIENYIDEDIDEYSGYIYSGDLGAAALVKGRLTALLNIKHSGKSSGDNEERALKKEREALENSLSANKKNIVSPMGGIFTSETDGFEGTVDFEKAMRMTVGEFDEIMKLPLKSNRESCKIVDNYKWLFMFKVPSDYATVTSVGRKVTIELEDGEEITGVIEYISQAENGECVFTVSSDRDFDEIGSARKLEATVTFNKYSGYVIPTDAFYVYDNKYGVFVESGNKLGFRETEVIYSDKEFTVVNPGGRTELKIYDNVVVEGDLSEFYD